MTRAQEQNASFARDHQAREGSFGPRALFHHVPHTPIPLPEACRKQTRASPTLAKLLPQLKPGSQGEETAPFACW